MKDLTKQFSEAKKLIEKSEKVIITAHQRPDGDACGSVSALSRIIADMGKQVFPLLVDDFPEWINMLFGGHQPTIINSSEDNQLWKKTPWKDADLIILADALHPDRAPGIEQLADGRIPSIVFDHHLGNDSFGDVKVVDSGSPAAGEIVFRFAKFLGYKPDKQVGLSLFAAMATDTGWFRYGKNLKAAYEAASELLETGIDTAELFSVIYERESLAKMRLTSRMLDSLKLHGAAVVSGRVTHQDFRESGAVESDTEGLINKLQALEGIQTTFLLIERSPGEIKCSMRSKGDIIVREVAEALGGGGHDLAAGVSFKCGFEEAERQILEQIAIQTH
ncbi:DHH family phosphoesterase [Sedimentisphaera cyanobacteriorum]|uniref:DHH family phosphoesterase n=1 Tax=Sedimentisphaera cyanobacteriorum TaxID=1940790 RepID=UPI00137286B7|nr:bifunctional oligoribonuclease/PAP phosphatase NrnA [Sedimentisphaera cyanobacteriorum]